MRRWAGALVALLLASGVGGCGSVVGDDEERYVFFLSGLVMYRCDNVTGDCIAGRAGEEGVYAVLPPAGRSIEEWAAAEGLRVTVGEGR